MNTTTQGIDRDKAIAAAARAIGMVDGPTTIGSLEAATAAADAVLALVRPVEGVTANLSESASEGDRRARVGHNHVTRDIKPEGQCPACDAYHLATRAQEARSAAVEDGTY